MKVSAKLLSVLLAVVMCCSFAVVPAYAEAPEEPAQSGELLVNGGVNSTNDVGGGSKTVSSANGVAMIRVSEDETDYYASVSDALEAAEKGQKVELADKEMKLTLTAPITIPEGVSLNLKGGTLVFIPQQNEEWAVFLENNAQIKNGALEVKTRSTDEETFTFAVAVDGEGVVFLDEMWASNEGGDLRANAAAAYELSAVEDNPGVYKFVKPVVEESENNGEPSGENNGEPSGENNEEPSGENNEEPSGENNEEPSGENNGEPSGENNEEPSGENNEEPSGENNEEPSGENNEEPSGENNGEEGEDEIIVEQQPDVVADEPNNVTIRNNDYGWSSISSAIAAGINGGYWLEHELTWDITDFGTVTDMLITCNYPITGDITVPAGVKLTLKKVDTNQYGSVNGNITVYGQLVLNGIQVSGDINLASTGTQAILNISGNSSAGNITVDGTAGLVSPNISDGKFTAITYTGSAANKVGGVTGGLFKSAVPTAVCGQGVNPAASKDADYPYTVASVPGSVKNLSGKTSADYYKGQPSKNVALTFAVSPGLNSLSVKYASTKSLVTTLSDGSDYNYYAAGGRVEISKNAAFLESLPAEALVLAFDLTGGGYVEFPLNVWANVTFSPSRYYKGSGTNVVFDVSDQPLEIIMDTTDANPGTVLAAGTDYTVSGNKITLPATFLESLEGGSHNFFFKYGLGGQTYRLRCTVAVLVDYRVFKINDVSVTDANAATVDWYTNSGKTLRFHADGPYEKFAGVKIGNTTLNAGNYSFAKINEGTVVTINAAFLNTLAKGNYPVTLLYKDGEATAQFDVHIGSSSPKTGDDSNILLWTAVMLLSGAAIVALLPKSKKQ